MATLDITTIDIAEYQTAPVLTTDATLTLAVDLDRAKPTGAPPHVDKAAKRMIGTVEQIKQEFVARVGMAGLDFATLMAFDTALDRFWHATRQRCYFWINFDHDGLDSLSEAEKDQLDLEDKREKAEIARELDKHLFGSEGLTFLRKPFNQQVVQMASRLTFIAASDKFAAFEEVIGPELLATLNVLQGRYEEMVHSRAMRSDDSANLRHLRATLQRHISLYANAVISMLDEDEPESIGIVQEALRPIVNARINRPRSNEDGGEGGGGLDNETEGEPLPNDDLLEPPQSP